MSGGMNQEFGSAIDGGGAGAAGALNDFGGYGEFGIPSGSLGGAKDSLGGFGALPMMNIPPSDLNSVHFEKLIQ